MTDYSPYSAYGYMIRAAGEIADQLEIRTEDISNRYALHVFEIGGGPGDSNGEPRRLRITPRLGEPNAGAAITAYAQTGGPNIAGLVELWRLELPAAVPEDVWTKALEAAIYALEVVDGAWAGPGGRP